jgi:hypothetical protein
MPKKITDRQRLLTYAMTAEEPQILEALETFKAALTARFPKERKKRAKRTPPKDDNQLTIPGTPSN